MVLKIMVLPRSFFIPMYYETDVILCSAWSSFLELGQAHYNFLSFNIAIKIVALFCGRLTTGPPPVTIYMGSQRAVCHVMREARPFCCVEWGSVSEATFLRQRSMSTWMRKSCGWGLEALRLWDGNVFLQTYLYFLVEWDEGGRWRKRGWWVGGWGGGWVAVLAVERDLYFSVCVTPDISLCVSPPPSPLPICSNIGLGIFRFYSLIWSAPDCWEIGWIK